MGNCTGLKRMLEDVDETDPDPLGAVARKDYHLPCSVMTPNTNRFRVLRALVTRFRPHCVIELVSQACLTYDVVISAGIDAGSRAIKVVRFDLDASRILGQGITDQGVEQPRLAEAV